MSKQFAGSNLFALLVWLVAVWILPVPLASRIFAQVVGESRETELVVGALNTNGSPVTGLTVADFRMSDHGRGTITSAEYCHNPSARVVVLLDESGSMSSRGISNKWKVARDAASEFVALAPSTMQLSMMSFRS